jgi:carbamoyl-phosphate synthase large subunit
MKIKTLLITAIGGDIAQATVDIIRKKRHDIKIIGTDTQIRHAGSLFVDCFEEIPSANHSNYLSVIKSLIKKFNVDVLLPMSEAELSIFCDIDKKIDDCIIVHCGKKGLEIGLDKLKTNQFLQSINALYPWTKLVSEANSDIEMPCIIKPKTGSGSKNISIIEDKIDFKYFKQKYPDYIFQELLKPSTQEITCAVYRSKEKKVYVLPMLRELTGGATGWATVINNQNIIELCTDIANKLDVFGSINIQLINTSKGAYVFEINPRISSTVGMRNLIGFNDVVWLIDEIEGKNVLKPNIDVDKILTKIHLPKLMYK